MKKFLLTAAVAAIAVATSSAVHAATADTTMGVSATVSRTCTVAADPLAFGLVNQAGDAAQSTVAITCTAGSTTDAPTVAFSAGGQAVMDQRNMIGGDSGTATVPYQLASTLGGTNLTAATGIATTVAGGGTSYSTTVYGSIPTGTYEIGNFTDTVTVTVTYATPE